MFQTEYSHTGRDPNIYAQVEPALPPYFRILSSAESHNIMSAAIGLGFVTRRSKQRLSGAPEARSLTPYPRTTFSIYQPGMKTLYDMPPEIVGAIFIEWTMLDWFAPATARQVCHYFKQVADSTPRLWSNLFLSCESHATADGVRAWLERGKAVPKEMVLASMDIPAIMAALESATDVTSLVYRVPAFEDSMDVGLQLPPDLLQLRHLHIDPADIDGSMIPHSIFDQYDFPDIFPCLTTMRLFSAELTDFTMISGLFPVMRHLVLFIVVGPILDLIQDCRNTLEDLRVTECRSTDQRPYPQGRIRLPNMKVLIAHDNPGIVSNLEAPNLRLLYADLDGIDGSTRPFPAVVEWATRQRPGNFLETDITGHLDNMPKLQRLMLLRHKHTLELCFGSLRDRPALCPDLQLVEVVDFMDTSPAFELDDGFKAVLEGCMEQRAANVPGFTLEFVENDVQMERLEQCYLSEVCLFISIRRCLSYHAFRNPLTRSKARWRSSKQTCLSLFGARIGTVGVIPATLRITASISNRANITQHSSS